MALAGRLLILGEQFAGARGKTIKAGNMDALKHVSDGTKGAGRHADRTAARKRPRRQPGRRSTHVVICYRASDWARPGKPDAQQKTNWVWWICHHRRPEHHVAQSI